jgi:hypothetical protein
MSSDDAVRPFRVGFPEVELAGLRRRVSATRWPDRETAEMRASFRSLR